MRALTKADKERGAKLRDLGCIVCYRQGVFTPSGIHHLDGQTKPGCHDLTIGLCGPHHQVASPVGAWATRHSPGRNSGKKAFEDAYGAEQDLLEMTNELIA